ncbi:LOW QUALITY PROTEIN: interleukin-17 receptor E-like protein [Brachionichthys hirsutus]|uniref:LOW QUALITY PROTEIN: interleukin-17 receptor E-like protein n=1 Tax=Brachionichthys hirsutus TaxID=412623 RepID=UPI0036048CE4
MKMMLLVFLCSLGLAGAAGLGRIEACGIRCSQGLQCKTKPHSLFPPPCETPPGGLDASSVFRNVSLATVMRCEGRQKCSLHLRIRIALQLTDSVHGVSVVSVCTVSSGMMENCRNISFKRASRERMSGEQVEVESDCTDVSPSQQVRVTVKTAPGYCGVTWTGAHQAPECTSPDLQRHVPECITGRLLYDINPQRKELTVSVVDMLEDHDYRLRLCHKDFICMGTGADALIKRDEPERSVQLQYSKPLPCLCIEGWSMVMDAPRVQVCPFRDRLEELWAGITFDPLEGMLSWTPPCPLAVVVVLCQQREAVCEELPDASRDISREKVSFTKVDPQPSLCMKFTVGSRSWTRCPFADARLQGLPSLPRAVVSQQASRDLTWVVVPAGVFLSGIVIVTLLTVCKSRKSKRCTNEKQTDLDFDRMIPALQTKPVLRGVLVPDSARCGNGETANLISD